MHSRKSAERRGRLARGGRAAAVTALVVLGLLVAVVAPALLLPTFGSEAVKQEDRLLDPFPGARVSCLEGTDCISGRREAAPLVALTFDDCDDTDSLDEIARTLAQQGATATFFCTTSAISREPALVREVAEAGNEFARGGLTFAHLVGLDGAAAARAFSDDDGAWQELSQESGVVPTTLFRPQFGRYDEEVARSARLNGLQIVLWDVDPEDWTLPGPDAIVEATVKGAAGGSIVLLHTNEQTALALPSIVAGLRAKGLRPTSVSSLIAA